jgi:hypothetical protein
MERIMDNKKQNPFSISKASDLSNEDIQNFWVDGINFSDFIDPSSLKPKIIVGGKGSGKTHLMKRFSYDVQILEKKTIASIIKDDCYIGIFMRASTLLGGRFNHTKDKKKWQAIFYYYFELFFTKTYLFPVLEQLEYEYPDKKDQLVKEILDLFDKEIEAETLSNIKKRLSDEVKKINRCVNDYLFDNDSINDINHIVSRTELIFGIPKVVKSVFKDIPKIEQLTFNYFIDEFENFEPQQQRYIQTLVRESGDICTFRIGIRSHAFNSDTLKTEHSSERNKMGSETEPIYLDDWLMADKKKYRDFALEIIQKKFNPENILDIKEYKIFLLRLFDESSGRICDSGKAFKSLTAELKKNVTNSVIQGIIKNLKTDDPLMDKLNIYNFYKNKEEDYLKRSEFVKKNGVSNNDKEKQKENMKAQLYEENLDTNPIYLGLDAFIKISDFNPRHMINIMGYVYDWVDYCEGDMSKKIPYKEQIHSERKLLLWFKDDYDTSGKYGHQLSLYIDKFCRYLKAVRFSPKPIDTSVTSFFVSQENYMKYKEQFDSLSKRMIIIKKKERKGKNKNAHTLEYQFRINFVYSEKYQLPLIDRGTIEVDNSVLNVIFDDNDNDDSGFKKILSLRQSTWSNLRQSAWSNLDSKTLDMFSKDE